MWKRLEKIKLFGYRLVPYDNYKKALDNQGERLKLIAQRDKLQNEIKQSQVELQTFRQSQKIFPIDINMKDPIPIEGNKRKEYVGEVAGLHTKFLKSKLEYMISNSHILFEEEGNTHEQDLQLKGVVFAFREILRWGEKMVNESIAISIDDPSTPEKELEEILK